MSFSPTSPAQSSLPRLVITTDGSCYPNDGTGSGAWAYVVRDGDTTTVNSGVLPAPTTNNIAELTAILRALESIPEPRIILLRTDSQYALCCLTRWCQAWVKRGWKTSQGADVKNRGLIEKVLGEMGRHVVEVVWVKSHNGDLDNEKCDELAAAARKGS
jgi:ribonuclease HI